MHATDGTHLVEAHVGHLWQAAPVGLLNLILPRRCDDIFGYPFVVNLMIGALYTHHLTTRFRYPTCSPTKVNTHGMSTAV